MGGARYLMLFFLVLLFLSACTHADQWTTSHIKIKGLDSGLTRTLYHTKDKVNGIDIELLEAKEHLTAYLQVHSQTIPPCKNDPKKCSGELIVRDRTYLFLAERHAGGQRLNVPQDIQTLMIKLIEEKKSFTLKIEGYEETVPFKI